MEIKEGHDYVMPSSDGELDRLFRIKETKKEQNATGEWYCEAEGFFIENGEPAANKPSVYQISEKELVEKGREATEQERSLLMDNAP